MAISIAPLYMGVGLFVVWFALFVAYYIYERRSQRNDEGTAAFVLSAVTVFVAVCLIALSAAIAWATQTFLPVFG